ncbi:T9SS type A sorting domain-containing protein [Chitinophagaceae bacterium MMS25-I14]
MKKFLLVIISAVGSLFAGNAQAQSFTTQYDTVFATYGGTELSLYNKISNPSTTSNVQLTWKVVSTNFPSAWTAICGSSTGVNCTVGICDNHACYNNNLPNQPIFGANAVARTSDPYFAGATGDFHLLLNAGLPAAPSGSYYLTVSLAAAGGQGTTKNITFVVNQWATGVNNISKSLDDVELFPNPAHGTLNINYDPNAGIRSISVYNLIGKAIGTYRVSGNNNNASIDISDVPSGVYFVRLLDAQNHVLATRKFTHQ